MEIKSSDPFKGEFNLTANNLIILNKMRRGEIIKEQLQIIPYLSLSSADRFSKFTVSTFLQATLEVSPASLSFIVLILSTSVEFSLSVPVSKSKMFH